MFNYNPFFHRGPISDPAFFYNRKVEIGRCLHLIKAGTSISIIGPRKIGKTSLLFHLINPALFLSFGLSTNEFLPVYFDCAGLYELTAQSFYELILEEIGDRLIAQGISVTHTLPDTKTAYHDFVRSIKSIAKNYRLVLIFDEFEGLSSNNHFDQNFFAGLRAMSITHNVTFITASKTPLATLTSAHKNSLLSSNFFNIFSPLYMSLFSDEEAACFVAHAVDKTEIRFSRQTIEWLIRISGAHPFFLQIAADCAYERKLNHLEYPLYDEFDSLEQQIYKEAIGHFQYYWDSLTENEQHALKTLDRVGRETMQEPYYSLKELCLIKDFDGGLTCFSPLFTDFVSQQHVANLLQAGPFLLDLHRQDVFVRGKLLELTDLSYDLLLYLVQAEGRVVSREELDREVWHPEEVIGGEERVKAGIKLLRQMLNEDKNCIVNRRGKGYAFLPDG